MANDVTDEKLIKSVITKMRYENPVKGNSILINESVCSQKKKCQIMFSLCCYTYYLLSFRQVKCSILDIKYTFFLYIILNIKFIIWYSLLRMSKKYAVQSHVSILINKIQSIVRNYSYDKKKKYNNLFLRE